MKFLLRVEKQQGVLLSLKAKLDAIKQFVARRRSAKLLVERETPFALHKDKLAVFQS